MNDNVPRGRDDGHEFDYSVITDKIFLGSDFCQGGVCLIHGDEFKRLNVFVEINLSAERNELPPKDIEGYVWLPVVDGHAPEVHQLDIGTAIINEAVENGRKVYVHCTNGHGRSPTLIAAYFVRYKNMSVEEAMRLVKEKRPEIHIEDVQIKALVDFKLKHQGRLEAS